MRPGNSVTYAPDRTRPSTTDEVVLIGQRTPRVSLPNQVTAGRTFTSVFVGRDTLLDG